MRHHTRMDAYSEDLRKKIVEAVERGTPKVEAARAFGVGVSSVERYVATAAAGRSLAPKTRTVSSATSTSARVATHRRKRRSRSYWRRKIRPQTDRFDLWFEPGAFPASRHQPCSDHSIGRLEQASGSWYDPRPHCVWNVVLKILKTGHEKGRDCGPGP